MIQGFTWKPALPILGILAIGTFFANNPAKAESRDDSSALRPEVNSFILTESPTSEKAESLAKDSDNDTFPDDLEISHGTDPEDQGSFPKIDSDGDGLKDAFERGLTRYELVTDPQNWDAAKQDAIEKGGHLATITSEEEWDTIIKILELTERDFNGRDLFLGGTDSTVEGDWRWVTGEPWSFTYWSEETGEPNHFGENDEDYLAAMPRNSLGWNNSTGITGAAYVFEKGYFTDPNDPDTDGDGVNDGNEYERNTNPNDPSDFFPPRISVKATRDELPLLGVKGSGSGVWIIERSTDLKSWKSWKAIDLESDSRLLLDGEASDGNTIFYRAVKQR